MLMVGYDDARGAFRVKNSWGERGLRWFSYDYVTRGLVLQAVSVSEVQDPFATFDTFSNPQLFLGRWKLDYDGERGLLDIYRLPDPMLGAGHDRRIGTFFDSSGNAFRVNGMLNGNELFFFIDRAQPDQPYDRSSGDAFITYVFSRDYRSMAGTMLQRQPARTSAVQASKISLQTGVASGPNLAPQRYLGVWSIAHDGQPSTLTFTSFSAATRALSGTYAFGNHTLSVTGSVSTDPAEASFDIPFPGQPVQHFDAWLNRSELGVMSGTTYWQNKPFGFWAYRQGDWPPNREPPDRPEPRVCARKPDLPQCHNPR